MLSGGHSRQPHCSQFTSYVPRPSSSKWNVTPSCHALDRWLIVDKYECEYIGSAVLEKLTFKGSVKFVS